MSRIAELARGVVIAGIHGTQVDSDLPDFGGYVLFPGDDASPENVRVLTDALRARSDGPAPLIAIDQEGGRVTRLRNGVEPVPSMMALGAADDVELAQRAGEQIAFDLRRAGCTLDFAPVLDLATDPQNSVIGTRSFGYNAQNVARLGRAFALGLERGGVLACYKHFPGHGATAVDSHEALPVVDLEESTLRARELLPFAAIAGDAPAMMSAHIRFSAFDSAHTATVSPRILDELLRAELGFNGVLVTDALEMGAVAEPGSLATAVAALAAGADALLFSHDLDRASAAVAALEAAVGDGRIPPARLAEAHSRVSALRRRLCVPLPLDAVAPHPNVGREIGRRGIALVRGVAHADPIACAAVSFGGTANALRREAPALEELAVALDPSDEETAAILDALQRSRRRPLVLARRADRHRGQARAIAAILESYPDALAVSMLEPFDLPLLRNARHLLATHGDHASSIAGLSDVLFGGTMPTAGLAVSVEA